MMSRSLIRREFQVQGLLYGAEDAAGVFLDKMMSPYIVQLRERADWVASTFDELSESQLDAVVKLLFEAWTTEFQPVQLGLLAEPQP
jgi:hypothetical protein